MKKEYTRPQVIIVEFQHQELMQQSSPRVDVVKSVKSNLPSGDVFELGGDGDGDDEDYEGDIR